jgi:hypothetical protein
VEIANPSGEAASRRRWLPEPTSPLRRAARLAAWTSPLVIATLVGLPVCPYAIVAREPCPGCGITRAAEALLHLDLGSALLLNPVSPVVVPAAAFLAIEGAILYVLRGRTRLNEPLRMWIGITLSLALAVVWLARKFLGAFGGPVDV